MRLVCLITVVAAAAGAADNFVAIRARNMDGGYPSYFEWEK